MAGYDSMVMMSGYELIWKEDNGSLAPHGFYFAFWDHMYIGRCIGLKLLLLVRL